MIREIGLSKFSVTNIENEKYFIERRSKRQQRNDRANTRSINNENAKTYVYVYMVEIEIRKLRKSLNL